MAWAWVLVVTVTVGIVLLARALVMNARALRRDVNKRFDALRERLERSANSVVDDLLNTHRVADSDSGRD
jgi:cell division protein FtsX